MISISIHWLAWLCFILAIFISGYNIAKKKYKISKQDKADLTMSKLQ